MSSPWSSLLREQFEESDKTAGKNVKNDGLYVDLVGLNYCMQRASPCNGTKQIKRQYLIRIGMLENQPSV